MFKKRIVVFSTVFAVAALSLVGCGTRTSELSTLSSATNETIKTRQIMSVLDYNPSKCVKLPNDYMSIKVDLDDDYTVSDKDVDEYISQLLMSSLTKQKWMTNL